MDCIDPSTGLSSEAWGLDDNVGRSVAPLVRESVHPRVDDISSSEEQAVQVWLTEECPSCLASQAGKQSSVPGCSACSVLWSRSIIQA